MHKKNPVYLTVILVAAAIIITFQATYVWLVVNGNGTGKKPAGDKITITDNTGFVNQALVDKLSEVAGLYDKYFPDEIDEDILRDYIFYAFPSGTGDEFGNYLSANDFKQYISDISGEYQGIGVSVIYNALNGALEIVTVFPDSPAEKAGVLAGDLITAVKGESVAELGYYGAVANMRGEAGTVADFTVARGATYETKVDFSVVRGYVTEQSIMWKLSETDKRIAVIRILEFNAKTTEQFEKALDEALDAGAEALVFDVRNNPGGSLDTICDILDMLLPEGPIIRIDYKGDDDYTINSDAECIEMPMAVLCNENTASAGELFCSALKDYKLAALVGTTTYGKGTMQSLFNLKDGSAITITVAYYLPPFSENYHHVGVAPDITAELPEALKETSLYKLTEAEDTQLQAAIKALDLK